MFWLYINYTFSHNKTAMPSQIEYNKPVNLDLDLHLDPCKIKWDDVVYIKKQ